MTLRYPTVAKQDRREHWPIVPVVLLFAAAWLFLTWPWLSGRYTVPWDSKAHFQAQLQFLADSLHRGEAPFWNPYVFAGSPQIADPQSLIFSLPHLLLAAVDPAPSFQAADGLAFAMLFLGGLGLILIFRDHRWRPAGALVAALVFAFGASAAWRIQHTGQILSLSYFPLALWALMRALERGSAASGFIAGVSAGMMVLGRDQIAWLGVYLLAGFVVWHAVRGPSLSSAVRGAIRPLLAGVVGGTLVAGLPLLMTLLLAGDSNRPAIDLVGAGRGSLHPASFLTAFVANLYGTDGPLADFWGQPSFAWGPTDLYLARNMSDVYIGALPLLAMLGIGVARGAFGRREIRYFVVAFVALTIFALGWYTPVFAVLFGIMPGIDLFRRPADATFLMGAMAAVLAGYAVHRFLESDGRPAARLLWPGIALMGLGLAACLIVAVDKGRLGQAGPFIAAAAGLTAISAGALLVARRIAPGAPLLAAALLGVVLSADLAWSNGPNESTALPPMQYDVLRPQSADPLIAFLRDRISADKAQDRRDRVELVGIDFHWPNASMVHRLDNTLGYNPLRLKLYAEATGAEDHAALPDQRVFTPLMPGYRSLLSDMLGLRYIATRGGLEAVGKNRQPEELPEVGRFASGRVFENAGAMPRVLFATQAQQADFDALLRTGRWPDFDPRRTVLLPEASAAPSAAAQGSGKAALRSYGNTEVIVHARSDAPGWVVLNDVWHPWWFAEVDGAPAPLLRANGIFRAVAAPAGEHDIRFVFRPLAGTLNELAARLGRPALVR
jgi:hypothetical protein